MSKCIRWFNEYVEVHVCNIKGRKFSQQRRFSSFSIFKNRYFRGLSLDWTRTIRFAGSLGIRAFIASTSKFSTFSGADNRLKVNGASCMTSKQSFTLEYSKRSSSALTEFKRTQPYIRKLEREKYSTYVQPSKDQIVKRSTEESKQWHVRTNKLSYYTCCPARG